MKKLEEELSLTKYQLSKQDLGHLPSSSIKLDCESIEETLELVMWIAVMSAQ